ncbi:CCA tRNA nucleotidyltransferase [bacterium]|nr:CCA tRNA nucleotidyltransferase [bacterium]
MKNRELDKIIELIASKIVGTEFANHTYVVGGFVRDLLLKNERNDLDFVVNLPQGGVRLASFLYKKKLCSRPIVYKRFGTAMIQMKGHKIEFVMTRNESYQEKSRHPEVDFASLQEDAFRRDFTINALYYNISDKKILDLTGSGLSDLDQKIIRSTSDPNLIFKEDPLRILRAIRFAGRLNFSIEEKTLQGIMDWRNHLQHISIERIKDETINMIIKAGYYHALKLCFETDIMQYIFPPLITRQDTALELMKKINAYPPDLLIRLALLSVSCLDPNEMQKAIIRLTINNKLAKKAVRIASCVQALRNFSQIESLNQLTYHNLDDLPLALQIMKINFPDFTQHEEIENKIEIFSTTSYPLEGNEIIRKLKLRDNKEKNFYIKEAKKIWIENPTLKKGEIFRELSRRRKESIH